MANLWSSFDTFIIRHQFELKQEDWDDISEKYELSIEMIRLFQNKINWRKIAQFQELSIDSIKEFIHYQLKDHMDVICEYQYLTQDFIEENKDTVNWDIILEKQQQLPLNFILNHLEDIKKFRENEETN